MLDADVVAVSTSSAYRVLSSAGLLKKWNGKSSSKGRGFSGPSGPHEHWHIDISYLNIKGTFYYLCSILDEFSRYVVHWEIRESMTEGDVEITVDSGRLTIRGEKQRQREWAKGMVHLRESTTGSFLRSFVLPAATETEEIVTLRETLMRAGDADRMGSRRHDQDRP